jgi:hypothetical protein
MLEIDLDRVIGEGRTDTDVGRDRSGSDRVSFRPERRQARCDHVRACRAIVVRAGMDGNHLHGAVGADGGGEWEELAVFDELLPAEVESHVEQPVELGLGLGRGDVTP